MTDILDTIDDFDYEDFDESDFDDEALEGEVIENSEVALISEMSEDEAHEITDAIRATATATYVLLARAHEGKAYKALGYETWAEYVKNEFDMSTQRSYQLLDLSKAVAMIESVTPEGTEVRLTEAQARDIKRELPRITEIIEEETEGMEPEDASETVDRLIEEMRDAKREEAKRQEELEASLAENDEEARNDALETAADALLAAEDEVDTLNADSPEGMTSSADDGLVEMDVDGDVDAGFNPESTMFIYNFFNMISGVTDLPAPEEMVNIIPESRADEVEEHLLEATSWLNRFQTLWEIRNDE